MSSTNRLSELVNAYELEIPCTSCAHVSTRCIGFVRANAHMGCPRCGAVMLLGISKIQQEVRRIERSFERLHKELRRAMPELDSPQKPVARTSIPEE